MKTFPIGTGTVQISPERESYTALRLKYQGLAENAKKDFIARFAERFKDMDQLHTGYRQVAQQYVDDAVDNAIRDLVTNGVMDVDDERFINQYLLPRYSWEDAFDEIDDQYLEIVLKASELDAYRTARREDRGGVIGGGFGLEGAAQGVAVATAANVAIGAVHGIVNLGGKVLSSIGDAQKKSKLYSDPRTKTHLAESIYQLIFQIHLAIVDVVNNRQPNRPFGNVSDEDGAKAKGLLENISKGRIAGEDADTYLIQALSLNPYDPALYSLWFDRHGDVGEQLERMAQYFGVKEVSDRKLEMIRNQEDGLTFSTPEECHASLANLEQYANSIGYLNLAHERERVLTLADRLDRERRTVNGTIYETLEATQVARRQWEDEQSRTLNGKLYETPKAFEVAKLQWGDDQSRTVKGVLYATQEEAETARNEKDIDFLLFAIILFFPLPNAFLTLTSGFSQRARKVAHLWLVIYLVIYLSPIYAFPSAVVWKTIGLASMGVLAMFVRFILMRIHEWIKTLLDAGSRKGEEVAVSADGNTRGENGRKWRDPDLSQTSLWERNK